MIFIWIIIIFFFISLSFYLSLLILRTEESEVETEKRLNKWDKFLESEENRTEVVENSINTSKPARELVEAEL